MAIERNNTALDFETMLRRHLKSGGAPVAACIGFDFDAASAYLEDALVSSARARYEAHLAGCASCRRHLIELARLPQLAPQIQAQPVATAGQAPPWIHWKTTVASWFDFSAWNWKWQTVGAAGAVFAVLVAAWSVQMWRQMSSPASNMAMSNPAPGIESAGPNSGRAESFPAPFPEPSPQTSETRARSYFSADSRLPSNVGVPPPDVSPKGEQREIAVSPSDELLRLNQSQSIGVSPPDSSAAKADSLPEAQQLRSAAANAPAPTLQPAPAQAEERRMRRAGQPQEMLDASDVGGRQDVVARITPPQEYNPMHQDPGGKPRGNKDQGEKTAPEQPKSGLTGRVIGRFWPGHKTAPDRKPTIFNEDEESFKSLTKPIRGKVFRFDRSRSMWIDKEYKPEMSRWRVRKLVRGSKEYEQVLADDPRLKEFFDNAPIIVVWTDRIYRVVDK